MNNAVKSIHRLKQWAVSCGNGSMGEVLGGAENLDGSWVLYTV